MLWQSILTFIIPFLPLLATTITVVACLWGAHHLFIVKSADLGNERLLPRQLLMLGLTLVGILAVVLALPVSEGSRNQIITLIGLVISGILAFSSSTIFANLMAGIMLRVTKPFNTGDFIKVGDYFGRLVERGLLDTEIQTENRELVALPNTYLIKNPISVTHSSGAIVSTTLSLGYDIHHSQVESLLMEAAKESGLEEPFVQVLELGDYSITYKLNGMLKDVKSLLSARSSLCRHVLDKLHGNNVEIMSPAFMAQRPLLDGLKMIPPKVKNDPVVSLSAAEEVVFDKAEKAEQLEKEKLLLLDNIHKNKAALKTASEEDKKHILKLIKGYKEQLKLMGATDIELDQEELPAE